MARNIFPSQNIPNAPGSDHFWKLQCRKSTRHCGAKHISKSKYIKHTRFGSLLEVEMSKKRRCNAKHISKSKVLKTNGVGPHLEVQMSKKCRKNVCHCGAKHISKSKVKKIEGFKPFLTCRCRKNRY